jgi:methionine aminopeptidase type I
LSTSLRSPERAGDFAPHGSAAAEEATLALMRRWFFARKPDAGFVLTDFPATLLQAKVFDEWLDARDEALTRVFAGRLHESVVQHYRTLGLLHEAGRPRRMTIPDQKQDGIAKMREACAIAATVLEQLKPLVRPGITTQDLEEGGRDWIARLGARSACYGYQHGSRRYPAHTCISVNDEVVHGIPSFRRVLRDGDIVSLDIVVWHDGYVGDNAFTVPVGTISRCEKLLRVTREALDLGIKQAVVGNASRCTAAIQQSRRSKWGGFSVVTATCRHGVVARCTSRRKFRTSPPRREPATKSKPG